MHWAGSSLRPPLSNARRQKRGGWPTSIGYPSLSPKAGTVLVRDWGGVTHQVKVLEDGILFRSKRYKSLSEVARVITGSRWSGPLFFGLKSAVKEQSHGTR